jgi:hypothetical protein
MPPRPHTQFVGQSRLDRPATRQHPRMRARTRHLSEEIQCREPPEGPRPARDPSAAPTPRARSSASPLSPGSPTAWRARGSPAKPRTGPCRCRPGPSPPPTPAPGGANPAQDRGPRQPEHRFGSRPRGRQRRADADESQSPGHAARTHAVLVAGQLAQPAVGRLHARHRCRGGRRGPAPAELSTAGARRETAERGAGTLTAAFRRMLNATDPALAPTTY